MRHHCAVCGRMGSEFSPTERAYLTEFTLKDLGIVGTHAHISCLATATKERHKSRVPVPPSAHTRQKRFFTKSQLS